MARIHNHVELRNFEMIDWGLDLRFDFNLQKQAHSGLFTNRLGIKSWVQLWQWHKTKSGIWQFSLLFVSKLKRWVCRGWSETIISRILTITGLPGAVGRRFLGQNGRGKPFCGWRLGGGAAAAKTSPAPVLPRKSPAQGSQETSVIVICIYIYIFYFIFFVKRCWWSWRFGDFHDFTLPKKGLRNNQMCC